MDSLTFIVIAMTLQEVKTMNRSDVQITLLTDPLIIGEKAILQCQSRVAITDFQYCTWSRIGRTRDRLATNQFSVNTSKYEIAIELKEGVVAYNLIIKNLRINDFHFRYRCELEFYSADIYMSPDKHNVISVPTRKDVTFTQSLHRENILGVFIINNIYPSISCNVEVPAMTFLNVSKRTVDNYRKEYTFTVLSSLKPGACNGSVQLLCAVSNHTFITEPYSYDVCSESVHFTNAHAMYILIAVLMSIGCVVFVILVVMLRKRKIRCVRSRRAWRNCTSRLKTVSEQSSFIQRHVNV